MRDRPAHRAPAGARAMAADRRVRGDPAARLPLHDPGQHVPGHRHADVCADHPRRTSTS